MAPIAERLTKLMVMEYRYSQEEAERLVKQHTQVVLNGILAGASLDAIIMSIEIVDAGMTR